MAQNHRPEVSAPRGAEQISLEQLVTSTSSAVLRIIKEHEDPQSGFVINPRIWCGIWFDLPRGPLGGPGGGGPIAGGG